MKDNPQFLAWGILIALSLIWGSSFILIKRGLEAFTPDQVGAIRIIAAGLFLLPTGISRLGKMNRENLHWLISVGFVGSFIPAFLFAKAQTQIPSSMAGILNALTPLFVGLIGVLMFRQRVGIRVGTGLLLGFIGCFLLITNGQPDFSDMNIYGLFVVAATLCYGFNVNIIKFSLTGMKALTITSLSLTLVLPLGLIYLFGFTPFIDTLATHPKAWESLGLIILLGVLGTSVALIMFNRLVQLTNPIFTASVTYLIPIVAVFWGLFDGETIQWVDVVGLVTIIGGVYLSRQKTKDKRQKTKEGLGVGD